MDYFSINQLSEITDINHMSIRRYLKRFKPFFRPKTFGSVTKYPSDDIGVLKLIFDAYSNKKNTDEIKEILNNKYNQIIDIVPAPVPTPTPNESIIKNMLDEIISKQNENISELRNDILNALPKIIDVMLEKKLDERLNHPKKTIFQRIFQKKGS